MVKTLFERIAEMQDYMTMVHGRDVKVTTVARTDGRGGTFVHAYRDGRRIDARWVEPDECEDGSCVL